MLLHNHQIPQAQSITHKEDDEYSRSSVVLEDNGIHGKYKQVHLAGAEYQVAMRHHNRRLHLRVYASLFFIQSSLFWLVLSPVCMDSKCSIHI
jgi:hypothetical protein